MSEEEMTKEEKQRLKEERRKAFISMLGPCYREWLRERAESDRGATPPRSSGPQPR